MIIIFKKILSLLLLFQYFGSHLVTYLYLNEIRRRRLIATVSVSRTARIWSRSFQLYTYLSVGAKISDTAHEKLIFIVFNKRPEIPAN